MNRKLIEDAYKLMQEHPDKRVIIEMHKPSFDDSFEYQLVTGKCYITKFYENEKIYSTDESIYDYLIEDLEESDLSDEEVMKEAERIYAKLEDIILISFD